MSQEVSRFTYIAPDPRYFRKSVKSAHEMTERILDIMNHFGHDKDSTRAFFLNLCESSRVVFALLYGSALSPRVAVSEIEDVDCLVVTQGQRVAPEWKQPTGVEVHFLRLGELTEHLMPDKARRRDIYPKAYDALAGIFAGPLLVIKYSEHLDAIIRKVRGHLGRSFKRTLSQLVEYDCMKMADRRGVSPGRGVGKGLQSGGAYVFYGSERPFSLEEAGAIIEEAMRRRDILPHRRPTLKRAILKRMGKRERFLPFAWKFH
jgi:hypothetical protein